jgi:hypothetical protein
MREGGLGAGVNGVVVSPQACCCTSLLVTIAGSDKYASVLFPSLLLLLLPPPNFLVDILPLLLHNALEHLGFPSLQTGIYTV